MRSGVQNSPPPACTWRGKNPHCVGGVCPFSESLACGVRRNIRGERGEISSGIRHGRCDVPHFVRRVVVPRSSFSPAHHLHPTPRDKTQNARCRERRPGRQTECQVASMGKNLTCCASLLPPLLSPGGPLCLSRSSLVPSSSLDRDPVLRRYWR